MARSLQNQRRLVPMQRRAYLSNYTLLREWLEKHEAKIQSEQELSNTSLVNPDVLQFWLIGSALVIVILRAEGHGWAIYTEAQTIEIPATLADAEARCGLVS